MVAVFLGPLYFAWHVYLLWRIQKWLRGVSRFFNHKAVFLTTNLAYLFMVCTIVIGFLSPAGSDFKRVTTVIGNYWLGGTLYVTMSYVLVWIFYKIVISVPAFKPEFWKRPHIQRVTGLVTVILTAVLCTLGIISAHDIKTKKYIVEVDEPGFGTEDLKICLVADIHMGYNIGIDFVTDMVEEINALDADLVLIGGDIFDNAYEAIEEPEKMAELYRQIKSRYGVYAVYGNHDIQEPILAGFTFSSKEKKEASPAMDEFLKKAGVINLRDEYVVIDDRLILYGRPDYERPGRGIEDRRSPQEIMDFIGETDLPVLVLDHEPRELDELAEAGVDIDLCGHTHDGQTFPGNIVCALKWKNSCGYKVFGDMDSIVTSGVGLFGPFMRLGTDSEVCEIVLTKKS